MRTLVLGGSGFIGRHVVRALRDRGHVVAIGGRHPARIAADSQFAGCRCAKTRFESLQSEDAWAPLLERVDVVVNCVGILRERGRETYDRVHHRAPAALALACARASTSRLVHVSALGLRDDARSGFLTSKLAGERAIVSSGAIYTIVRPSLLDGDGGYGAAWLRRVARWPIHPVAGNANGRICVLDVRDLADAIVALCERNDVRGSSIVELGGRWTGTMIDYLAALRSASASTRAASIEVPPLVAQLAAHVCDALHVTPFSFGHLELMRRDNVPSRDDLSALLPRPPRDVVPVGDVANETRSRRPARSAAA